MRGSVHESVMEYCYKTNMTAGQFYELSAIDYMQTNPPPECAPITVIAPCEQEHGMDNELQQIICVAELEEFLSKRINGAKIHITLKKKLLKILKECYKVKSRGDKLNGLIEEAKIYFE